MTFVKKKNCVLPCGTRFLFIIIIFFLMFRIFDRALSRKCFLQ